MNTTRFLTLFDDVRAFLPTDIAGLALWLDAADAATLTLDGSNNVSAWADKSGAGLSAAQATTTKRPSYTSTNRINGINIVDFDGTDDCLQIASITLPVDSTIFAVFDQDNASTKQFFIEHSSNAGSSNGFWIASITPAIVVRRAPHINSNVPSTLASIQGTAARVITGVVNRALSATGAINRMRLDGSELTMVASGSNSGTTVSESNVTDTLNIGARNNGASLAFDGGLAELLIYSGVLSAGNITAVEDYLSAKWGTP